MSTQLRKQREIAERERLILAVARRELVERGYLGLNMERIARLIEYSKGTVYQHFASKEEVVCALILESQRHRLELFSQAASFGGLSREKLVAVGVADEVFVRQFPDHFRCEQIVTVASISEKLSEQSRVGMQALNDRIMETILDIVREGLAAGDVTLPAGTPENQILLGLWSMSVGAHSIANSAIDVESLRGLEINQGLWQNYHTLLDGYGWKPLYSEWDYAATEERARRELFREAT